MLERRHGLHEQHEAALEELSRLAGNAGLQASCCITPALPPAPFPCPARLHLQALLLLGVKAGEVSKRFGPALLLKLQGLLKAGRGRLGVGRLANATFA